MRTDKIARIYDVAVELVHFPLNPDTPAEGLALQALFRTGPEGIAEKNAQMKARMDAEGLAYSTRTHTYNSRLAQELGKWADSVAPGSAIHDALYRAYFVDTRNIGDPAVLFDLVAKVGLDVEAAREVLEKRTFREAVDADWAKSRAYGVTGVPTFVAGRYGVVGAQPYEAIEQLLLQVGAKRRDAS